MINTKNIKFSRIIIFGLVLFIIVYLTHDYVKTKSNNMEQFKKHIKENIVYLESANDKPIASVEIIHDMPNINHLEENLEAEIPTKKQFEMPENMEVVEIKPTEKIWNIPKPKVHEEVNIVGQPDIQESFCQRDSLLIICMSTANNVAYRNAIRETWANQYRFSKITRRNVTDSTMVYKVVFFIGKTEEKNYNLRKEIEEEKTRNNDIVVLDIPESKYEYTRKFTAAMKWISEMNCSRIKFVLRVLDDVFVNAPIIIEWLSKFHDPQHVYLGHLLRFDEPIRNVQHPLYTSENDYPEKKFPEYIKSPVYLFSIDTVKCLNSQINQVRSLPMEDAYIGLLAKKCGIKPKHNEHFVLMGLPNNVCHHRKMFFIGYLQPIDEVNIYHNLKTSNVECEEIEMQIEL